MHRSGTDHPDKVTVPKGKCDEQAPPRIGFPQKNISFFLFSGMFLVFSGEVKAEEALLCFFPADCNSLVLPQSLPDKARLLRCGCGFVLNVASGTPPLKSLPRLASRLYQRDCEIVILDITKLLQLLIAFWS